MFSIPELHGTGISGSHPFHEKVVRDRWFGLLYHPSMINSDSNATRTLTLVLPEEDWKALRAAEPDAIGWLRTQIQNRLAESSAPWSSRSNPPSAATGESWWGNEDEY
jgi:hypothetical protein